MSIGGARLAGAAMRAGLIDEYQVATHPVLVGGGTRFFAELESRVNLTLVETRMFPGGVVRAGCVQGGRGSAWRRPRQQARRVLA